MRPLVAVLALPVLITACGRPPIVADPQQREFWNALRSLCGQSFNGRLMASTPADAGIVGQPLVLDVWQCYAREIRMAFHIGYDHSRLWVLTPTAKGLRLVHQLHDANGEPLPFSGYGGDTRDAGSATTQRFAPDAETTAQVPSAASSVWSLEVVPGTRVTYALRSAAGEFRVDFDIHDRTATRPPAPWGLTRVRRAPPDTTGSR